MTYSDLYRKLDDQPFQPFRIRLSNGSSIEIHEPGAVIVGESSAVVPTDTIVDDRGKRVARDWKTIAIAHIVEFNEEGPARKKNRA